jgi:hypothetical protein
MLHWQKRGTGRHQQDQQKIQSFYQAHQSLRQKEVSVSSRCRKIIACSLLSPHMSIDGLRLAHTAGRDGSPKILQRSASSSCTQRIMAGFPSGMPGIADEMDGAMQQAAQAGRHSGMVARVFI